MTLRNLIPDALYWFLVPDFTPASGQAVGFGELMVEPPSR
jgi:hypothetical protein